MKSKMRIKHAFSASTSIFFHFVFHLHVHVRLVPSRAAFFGKFPRWFVDGIWDRC